MRHTTSKTSRSLRGLHTSGRPASRCSRPIECATEDGQTATTNSNLVSFCLKINYLYQYYDKKTLIYEFYCTYLLRELNSLTLTNLFKVSESIINQKTNKHLFEKVSFELLFKYLSDNAALKLTTPLH